MQTKFLSTGLTFSFLVIMLSARILAQGSSSYEDALDRGAALLQASRYEQAIQAYKEAERSSQSDSTVCQLGLAMAYNGIGASKNAAKAARKVIVASTDPEILAMANNQLGVAVFSGARGKKGRLEEAEHAFRQALELSEDEITIAAYNLGLVLLQLERDSEGMSAFGHFLELEPEGKYADQAREYVDNPRRARENFAPNFSVVTLDGEYLSLEDLKGKAVLLDFWATWFGPCRYAVPHLRRLSRKMQKDPFVIVGLSSDNQESELWAFVETEKMHWPQHLDERGKIAKLYGVKSFPTYVLIDHEGIIVYRHSGWSQRVGQSIGSEVSRAIRKAKKAAKVGS